MAKVIRVRRANNAKITGKHFTLVRVKNVPSEQKVFAFAVDDEGSEVYIPAAVVKKEQMTPADEGAGFTANVRVADGYQNDLAHPHVMLPISWDGEAEEIEVDEEEPEVTPSDGPSDDELVDLGNMIADAATLVAELEGKLGPVFTMAPDIKERFNTVLSSVKRVQERFDELFPESE